MVRIQLPPFPLTAIVICGACFLISLILHSMVNTSMLQLSFKRRYSYVLGVLGLEDLYNRTVLLPELATTSDHLKDMQKTTKAGNGSTVAIQDIHTPSKLNNVTSSDEITSIAIGMGITSKKATKKGVKGFLDRMPIFKELLPSFCATASKNYKYSFYLGYDNSDKFFTNETMVNLWTDKFTELTKTKCTHLGEIEVNFIQCNHSGRPAWAQNDAMMAAYKDGHDFFYRVNDDTIMVSKNWTNIFIAMLQKMKPPLVGVVGPRHYGGNTEILTYDFVHKTHMDIFGFYYPREFPWWYADKWITNVYKPGRSKKVERVTLRHTMSLSCRYNMIRPTGNFFSEVITKTRIRVKNYLNGTAP